MQENMVKYSQLALLPSFYLAWKEVIQHAVKQESFTY